MNFRNTQTLFSKKIASAMQTIILLSTLCLTACAQDNAQSPAGAGSVTSKATPPAIPELHKIQEYEFAAPYSCKGSYERSALFLSEKSKNRNSPELLFNGTCGSTLYFDGTTAGDDFGLIADLGAVSIESVTASKAFNFKRVVDSDNIFAESAPVVAGHTYAVLTSKRELRALFIVNVQEIFPNGRMRVSYAVKSYSIQTSTTEAPGFEWEKENSWK
jgi:hypothetical protein